MRKYNWTRGHYSFRLILATTMILGFSATSLIPAPADATPSSQRFELLRSHEEFTVPANVFVLTFEASGATGQWGWDNAALVTGSVTVTPGEVLKVYVGGAGHPTMGAGGYPNGGAGGGNNGEIIAGGGGGSSHIEDASGSIVLVAGGGGGSTNYALGGTGGEIGGDGGLTYAGYPLLDGNGGTHSASGTHTQNFSGAINNNDGSGFMQGGEGMIGAGGGGGYYGGSGGAGDLGYNWDGQITNYGGTGGGGSSYVRPSRLSGQPQPTYARSTTYDNGYIRLSWVPSATTTPAPTPAPTPTPTTPTSSPGSGSSSDSSSSTTPSTTVAPSWTSTPLTESESSISGLTPFPKNGVGSIVVSDEGGFVISKSNVFLPKWRTRVYIGTFKFSLKATYVLNKKKRTYVCTFPMFGTERTVASSNRWRWYQPPKGCTLPKELVAQLSQKKTTMSFRGSFTRRWATSGKPTRPDGSRIGVRMISLTIAASDTVALN